MEVIGQAIAYGAEHPDAVWAALVRHVQLAVVPVALGLVIGVPLGLWSARSPRAAAWVVTAFNSLRVIPSLAILFLAVPVLGLSFASATVALTALVVPPIGLATDAALRTLDNTWRETAVGLGMTPRQVFWRVELPLALPAIAAGVRTATVEAIASATLAAFIGAGGFGDFIVLGFTLYDPSILLVGAIPTAVLALSADLGLSWLERRVQRHRRHDFSAG